MSSYIKLLLFDCIKILVYDTSVRIAYYVLPHIFIDYSVILTIVLSVNQNLYFKSVIMYKFDIPE